MAPMIEKTVLVGFEGDECGLEDVVDVDILGNLLVCKGFY